MKFRVRRGGDGSTHRVEVPELSDLKTLKEKVARAIGVPAASVRLSLNKVDPLDAPGGTSVSSLGLRGGDLIYLMEEGFPNGGVPPPPKPGSSSPSSSASVQMPQVNTLPRPRKKEMEDYRTACANAAERRMTKNEGLIGVEANSYSTLETANHDKDGVASTSSSSVLPPEPASTHPESADPDSVLDSYNFGPVFPVSLRKSFESESSKIASPEDALVVAIHAVMVETGLTIHIEGNHSGEPPFKIPHTWNLKKGPFTLRYCLSQTKEEHEKASACKLTFQKMGSSLLVYGTFPGVSGPDSQIFRLSLSFSAFCSPSFLSNPSLPPSPSDVGSVYIELNQLWKDVKDSISLPLFTALCRESGLALPPCFPLLPTEIKLQILERLPTTSLVHISMVSKEFHFLSSTDSLWKALYQKEFGLSGTPKGSWKKSFVTSWIQRKRRRVHYYSLPQPRITPLPYFPFSPFTPPGMIGGDYDRFPAIGDSNSFLYPPNYHPRFATNEIPTRQPWNPSSLHEDEFNAGGVPQGFEALQGPGSRALQEAGPNLNAHNPNFPLPGNNRRMGNFGFPRHDII